MNEYKDNIIEFIIPQGYKVCKQSVPIGWVLKKRPYGLIAVQVVSSDEIGWYKFSMIDNISPKEGVSPILPSYLILPKKKIYYSGTVHNDPPDDQRIFGIITYENYGVTFSIKEFQNFSIDKYADFLESIHVNEIGYQKFLDDLQVHFQKQREKENRKNESLTVPFELPQEFIIEQLYDEEIIIRNKNFVIKVYDHSGLGREADIDSFLERQKNGNAETCAGIFPLSRGKKCFVENSNGESINFSQCKNIRIILSCRENCYVIHFENDKYFDLNQYTKFLMSIGRKKKVKGIP